MSQQPFRIPPAMPVTSYKTYRVTAPLATHFRTATCAEVNCPTQAGGWITAVDETDELGAKQAFYIRNHSGRRYTEDRNHAPGLTAFVFPPGEECFAAHKVPLDRPALFIVRSGDWRGNPFDDAVRRRPDDWVDDFANHQQQLADKINQG